MRNLGCSVLSDSVATRTGGLIASRLNAPFGARCFLTSAKMNASKDSTKSLNAPFGARCFLTHGGCDARACGGAVLMHRLALGAF